MTERPSTEQVREALTKLDVADSNHWTNEGLPALDAVKAMLDGRKVTRSEVTEAAPMFNRDNPNFEEPKPAKPKEEVDDTPTPEEELQSIKNQLDEVDAQVESLRKRRLELQAEHDRLNTALSAPKMTAAENIARYLQNSFEQRMARASGLQRAKELMGR